MWKSLVSTCHADPEFRCWEHDAVRCMDGIFTFTSVLVCLYTLAYYIPEVSLLGIHWIRGFSVPPVASLDIKIEVRSISGLNSIKKFVSWIYCALYLLLHQF